MKDGSCGFQACLETQGLNKPHWIGVRCAMFATLEQKDEHYLKTIFVNSPEELNDFRETLMWFKRESSIEKYMVIRHAGYLIADHYRTCIHFYSEFVKTTFLPSNNPKANKSIPIVHESYQYQDQLRKQVHSGHYSARMMKDDSPVFPIAPHCRFTKSWRSILGERVKLGKKLDKTKRIPSNKVPSESRKAKITIESSEDKDYNNVGMTFDFEDKHTENAAKVESVIADEERIILPIKGSPQGLSKTSQSCPSKLLNRKK